MISPFFRVGERPGPGRPGGQSSPKIKPFYILIPPIFQAIFAAAAPDA
jgi:hypothetical protein